MSAKRCETLWRAYYNMFTKDVNHYAIKRVRFYVPIPPQKLFVDMVIKCNELFKKEPTTILTNGNAIIAGEIQGSIVDLLKVFHEWNKRRDCKLILLGNIIGVQEFSLETLTLVMVAKILYPDKIIILRGTNEFIDTANVGGLMSQLNNAYQNEELYNYVCEMFSYIPLAAVLNGDIFITHGGIGPEISSVDKIPLIPRPLVRLTEASKQLLYSTPTNLIPLFMPASSALGYVFGEAATGMFLDRNLLRLIIRTHSAGFGGAEMFFDGRVISLTCSNVAGREERQNALFLVDANEERPIIYDAMRELKRADTVPQVSSSDTEFRVTIEQSASRRLSQSGRLLSATRFHTLPQNTLAPLGARSQGTKLGANINTKSAAAIHDGPRISSRLISAAHLGLARGLLPPCN